MNSPEKKQRKKPRRYERADFKAITDKDYIQENNLIKRTTPHELKIAKYRDQMLQLARSRMSGEMFLLLEGRSESVINVSPDNTEIALYSDFVQFLKFCEEHKLDALPFKEYAIDHYLSSLMAASKSRATIDRHIASLAKWANYLELDDPRKTFKVQMRIKALRKVTKQRNKQAEGIRSVHLNAALERLNPSIPRDCQDITLLFVGWETMCRRSELVSFNWNDFELQLDGSGLLYLEQSKTDKEGNYLYLSPYTCNILLGWRTRSKPKSNAVPIFRGLYSNGTIGDRLSVKGVDRCFKRIAKRLGLPESIFSGHSTRVGSAQEMIERDIDSAKIMLSGRWRSITMLTRYAKKINVKKGGMADLTRILEKERSNLELEIDSEIKLLKTN